MPGTPHYGDLLNKDVLSFGENQILSDNVACFLRLMGFQAIVPGQQDFYFGPEHLRQLDEWLGPVYTQVMNAHGANLMVEMGATLAHAPTLAVTDEVLTALNAAAPRVSVTPLPGTQPQGR